MVKVLEVCGVAPPPGSVTPTSLPLSFFDLFSMTMVPPQFLYFYYFPHPNTHFIDSVLPRIKHSLSLTLQHFYPLAGNLVWPLETDKPVINYVDGDSVSLTVAEFEDDFYHLSGDHGKGVKESHTLVPPLALRGEVVPVLALQVSLFPNAGICIGMNIHHGAVDGRIATQFMKSWTSVCRLGDTSLLSEALPFYDKTVIKDTKGLERIYLKDLAKFFDSDSEAGSKYRKFKVLDHGLPSNMVRATFELSEANVAKLKKWVLAHWNKDEQKPSIHISTFVVTCAHAWVCLIKAGEEVNENIVYFAIPVECRARLDPPVPTNYFGNCISGVIVLAKRNDLMGQDGITIAAKSIHEAIKGLDKNGIFSGLFGSPDLWVSNMVNTKPQRALSAAGSPRFLVYDTDFGWGKPKKVEMISIDRTGGLSFLDSREGDGGIEIGLVLNKSEMDTFASEFINGLKVL